MGLDMTLVGDTVINADISFCTDDRFQDLLALTRDADVSLAHLETTCHDYTESEVYPAAQAGGTWMRGPRSAGDELAWAGFDMVSHASNHAMDFSVGGMRETWDVLDAAGIAHAGTGDNLADAREPAFVSTAAGRVGLVSMTASFAPATRAGEARRDMRGRPGVNPLRYTYEVDDDTFDALKASQTALGQVVVETEDELVVTDPASRNMERRYERSGDGETHRRLHDRDRAENLRAIEWATADADVAVAHIHTHEFQIGGGVEDPPSCLESFARSCVDHGADVVVIQGSHAPTRGIEIHDDAPILYDPGDFFIMADEVTRQPADFYYAHADGLSEHPLEASLEDAIQARGPIRPWESNEVFDNEREMLAPADGFFTGPGSVLARLSFDDDHTVNTVELHPFSWLSEPESATGIPRLSEGEEAHDILAHVSELAATYGTDVEIEDGVGTIRV